MEERAKVNRGKEARMLIPGPGPAIDRPAQVNLASRYTVKRGETMKRGMSLTEMAAEIERQAKTKVDYAAFSDALSFDTRMEPPFPDPEKPARIQTVMNLPVKHESGEVETLQLPIRPHAHSQIAQYCGIPENYYKKCLDEAPGLLPAHVNNWFTVARTNKGEVPKRMIRTLDGEVRAFVSNRFRRLEYIDLANASLPILMDQDREMQIKSCSLTETRMYIQAVSKKLEGEVKRGDVVQAGICLYNSEVGKGSIGVDPLTYILACLNGMVSQKRLRRRHVGRENISDLAGCEELLSDDTMRKMDSAFFDMVRDVIKGCLTEAFFQEQLQTLRRAAGQEIKTTNLQKVAEVTAQRFQLTEGEKDSFLKNLIEGKDLSQWGVSNAVTRIANDAEDYDRAVDLEMIGGQVIDLNPKDWRVISEAGKKVTVAAG